MQGVGEGPWRKGGASGRARLRVFLFLPLESWQPYWSSIDVLVGCGGGINSVFILSPPPQPPPPHMHTLEQIPQPVRLPQGLRAACWLTGPPGLGQHIAGDRGLPRNLLQPHPCQESAREGLPSSFRAHHRLVPAGQSQAFRTARVLAPWLAAELQAPLASVTLLSLTGQCFPREPRPEKSWQPRDLRQPRGLREPWHIWESRHLWKPRDTGESRDFRKHW